MRVKVRSRLPSAGEIQVFQWKDFPNADFTRIRRVDQQKDAWFV